MVSRFTRNSFLFLFAQCQRIRKRLESSARHAAGALYSIIQMPPGIPVATVAINGAMNAAILAVQMLALSNTELADTFAAYKEGLKKKIVKANEELKEVKFEYKTN